MFLRSRNFLCSSMPKVPGRTINSGPPLKEHVSAHELMDNRHKLRKTGHNVGDWEKKRAAKAQPAERADLTKVAPQKKPAGS